MGKATLSTSSVLDFQWRKLRKLEGAVVDNHLAGYLMKNIPKEAMQLVIEDCFPEDLSEFLDYELLFNHFILPWSLFNWLPFDDFGIKNFSPDETLAQNYLRLHRTNLSNEEQRFIEAMNTTYYSFYAVLEVEENNWLLVKDILLKTTHSVKERKGTHFLNRGDIIYSRILTLDEQSIFVGMAPFLIPAMYHNHLINFRKWLIEENGDTPLSPEVLREELDLALLDNYFDILRAAFNKPLPTLCNTDGELMQFCISHFKLMISPEEALSRLISMTLSNETEELMKTAKRNQAGKIVQIEFAWLKKKNKRHKDWDNTVLGNIKIEEEKFILETNSLERTERGKKLLSKLLGDTILFQQTLIESPEQKIQAFEELTQQDYNSRKKQRWMGQDNELIQKMAKTHWENWFDESIPALNNQTPREAAETEEGREYLEALLLQYERYDLERNENDPFKADINFIKKELSL
jgi:hypothetical protein